VYRRAGGYRAPGSVTRRKYQLDLFAAEDGWPLVYSDVPVKRVGAMQLNEIVHSDPEIMSGTPVFVGTRVPVQSLFDYLEGGETLDEFLDQFPTVKREQALAALEIARQALLASANPA
jgi:uncharacterized protein (DUF433 family)